MSAVCVLAALSLAASAQQPPPAPAPAPPSAAVGSASEQESHLKIDMGSLVARAVAQMLATPRFFLYWVRSKSAPERFVYVVREGPVSENDRASVPGTEWELLTSFVDAAQAAETLARLQRGISPPSRPEASRGAGLWAVPRCGR